MKKTKICFIGIVIGMLMMFVVLSAIVSANENADVEIAGGLGMKVKITNVGNESILGLICAILETKFIHKMTSMSPGMNQPLLPGESLAWRWVPRGYLFVGPFADLNKIPFINLCQITVMIYENGGNNTIYGEKTVNAMYLCGFIILLK